VLYLKVNRAGRKEPAALYTQLLLYTLERADRAAADRAGGARGEFVAVIDLDGFSMTSGLPSSVLQDFFSQTGTHYPSRLGAIYLVNPNTSFNMVWGIVKGQLRPPISKLTFLLPRVRFMTCGLWLVAVACES
jgi:hypothetical protein